MADYHFYLLGTQGEILRVIDRELLDDEAARSYARSLLSSCVSIDVFRGALPIGVVERSLDDPRSPTSGRAPWRWLFLASRPPNWMREHF